MRRIIMFNRVTPEGFFAVPDGNLNWAVPDDELDQEGAKGSLGVDTMLFGRRTYDMFESFWPHALDDSKTARDPHSQRRSEAIRAMAVWINEAPKVVFSKTRKAVSWKNSRLISEFDPREIEVMKKEPGKNMIIFGSGSLVSQLTLHRLIDEYQFILSPVLLGAGRPLFDGLSKGVKLHLEEAKPYRSGNVKLRYTLSS
jgi:dihydrofolate reductase